MITELAKKYGKYNLQNTFPKAYSSRKTGILFNADNVMAINQKKQTNEWNTEWNTEAHFLK